MVQVLYIVIIFLRILSATSVEVYHYFRKNTELSNKVLENVLTKDIQTSSLLGCGARCHRCCRCFGFNTLTNICRIFQTCDQEDVINDEDGWIYHSRNELGNQKALKYFYVEFNDIAAVF